MQKVISAKEFQSICWAWRATGQTMVLVRAICTLGISPFSSGPEKNVQKVVASLFVNSTQFGPDEDQELPPRLDGDTTKVQAAEVDVLFTPETGELYAFTMTIRLGGHNVRVSYKKYFPNLYGLILN